MVVVTARTPGREAELGMVGRRADSRQEGKAEEAGEKRPEGGHAELRELYVPKLNGS